MVRPFMNINGSNFEYLVLKISCPLFYELMRFYCISCTNENQGPYCQPFFWNVLALVLQIFLDLEAFESTTTFD